MIPNYRKRQLQLGLPYIPESLIFKDYLRLNKDSYMEKRFDDFIFNNKNLKLVFDLSFPINGQFGIDNLNLIDKHMFGSNLEKFTKLKKNESFNNYYSKRFDSTAYHLLKKPYNTAIPYYITNRNFKFMRIVNNNLVSNNFNMGDMLRNVNNSNLNL